MQYSSNHLNPSHTPKPISIFLTIVASASVLSTVLNTLFFGTPGLEAVLGLSWAGIKKSFFWQLLSYPYILENEGSGLAAGYIFHLGFNLYILWVLSTVVLEHIGKFKFLFFSTLCTVLAGLSGLYGIHLTGHDALLMGQTPLILSLLTLWTVLNSETTLLFFFLFPIKIKWLTLGALSVVTFNSISHLDLPMAFFNLAGPLFAYFFGMFMSKRPLEAFKNHIYKILGKSSQINEKIIDFRTGKPKK